VHEFKPELDQLHQISSMTITCSNFSITLC